MMVTLRDIHNRSSLSGFACPRCENRLTGITDTRRMEGGHKVRRRRLCANCGNRWTTYERWEVVGSEDTAALMDRWLNVHDVCGMGERAVEMSK